MHATHQTSSLLARIFAPVFQRSALARQSIAIFVTCLVCLPSVQATAKDKSLAISMYVIAYANDLKSVAVKSGKDRYQDIILSTANVVEARAALVENGRIRLYGPAGADGKRPAVADVEVSGILQPLIVLHPAADDSEMAYEALVVEGDAKKFPLGSFNLVNLSPHDVRITHEDEVIELETKTTRIFKPDHPAGESLAMSMDYKTGENWTLLSSARWPARNDRRTLVCFQLDPASKRMNVKSVPLRGNAAR